MKHNPTHIGQIESVSGNSVTIKMASAYPSNMPIVDGAVYRIGQIGSFLKIPLGYASLFGLVTQAGALAMPDSLLMAYAQDPSTVEGHRWLRMILIGEQIGESFERGVLQPRVTRSIWSRMRIFELYTVATMLSLISPSETRVLQKD